ncbi:hypothetical protein lerEdw1_010510 [Lerista edwardsae]|nr:hypothetical protein lerEdw1_010510 [Lerista edwardsae]
MLLLVCSRCFQWLRGCPASAAIIVAAQRDLPRVVASHQESRAFRATDRQNPQGMKINAVIAKSEGVNLEMEPNGSSSGECSEQRMFRGNFPTSPFIYYYDNEYDMKRAAQRAKKKAQELQEAGLLPVALTIPYTDDGQKEHGHKKKRKMKDHDKRKEKLHHGLKKKSHADKFKGRNLKKVVQDGCHMEENFPRGGHRNALKWSKKARTQHDSGLPTNGDKPEMIQASSKALKKRKKKQRNHTSNSPTRDEDLFLIKQRKKKSKRKPNC